MCIIPGAIMPSVVLAALLCGGSSNFDTKYIKLTLPNPSQGTGSSWMWVLIYPQSLVESCWEKAEEQQGKES